MNADAIVIHRNLAAVRMRIERACQAAGRSADAVALLAVSKGFGAEAVRAALAAGQRAFGESYLQEALAKQAALAGEDIAWHFIGPIQSNKTRDIAAAFDWVHGVDRLRIAQRLSDQRPDDRAPLQVCVQVNVSGEASKSGCRPEETADLCRAVAALPRLRLRGLMAIPAPVARSPNSVIAIPGETARPYQSPARPSLAGRSPAQVSTGHLPDPALPFRSLRTLFEAVRGEGLTLDTLSAGMSDDLEAAIAEGATIVRVGTAVFGRRET